MLLIAITVWLFLMSAGQMLFKYSAMYVNESSKNILTGYLLNPFLIIAIIMYFLATILWVYILRKLPLSQAYPLNAIGFIIVPILASIIFKETLTLSYWMGILLILAGIMIITLNISS